MKQQLKPTIEQVSEQSYLFRFGERINEQTADRILWVTQQLKTLNGVRDFIPSYTTVLVTFDVGQEDKNDMFLAIDEILTQSLSQPTLSHEQRNPLVIPVYYGLEVGPDLNDVAHHCQMTPDQVIQQHHETLYRAYAIGFTPGFAFLGSTPKALHTPRKHTPRYKVPRGSVAIAEHQTAIYPTATPGGWQIIGRTPLDMIDWNSQQLSRVSVGDSVRFEPISRESFLAQGGLLDGF